MIVNIQASRQTYDHTSEKPRHKKEQTGGREIYKELHVQMAESVSSQNFVHQRHGLLMTCIDTG